MVSDFQMFDDLQTKINAQNLAYMLESSKTNQQLKLTSKVVQTETICISFLIFRLFLDLLINKNTLFKTSIRLKKSNNFLFEKKNAILEIKERIQVKYLSSRVILFLFLCRDRKSVV